MMEFQSTDSYKIEIRSLVVYEVRNPVACKDFDHLEGHVVLMNGVQRKVHGIVRHPRLNGWREGEGIGLAFKED